MWAQAEPARVAAFVQAAPAQQRWRRSPGGTTLQQAPLPPVPATPPAQTRGTPEWDAWQQQQQQRPPIPDAWAAAAAAADASQTMPGATRHFNINTPGYTGGGGSYHAGGGGKGGAPYPREMRIDSRGWGSENKKLDITTSFDAFQVWRDRAKTFLSRERPDVRKLLTWAEAQTKDGLEENIIEYAERLGVIDDLLRVDLELGPKRLAEGDCLGGDHMHQRAALKPRKHRRIDLLGNRLVVGQHHAAARAAQRFVRGGGRDMGMRHRRRVRPAGDEASDMGHVDHQPGADFIGDLAKPRPVPDTGIGGAASEDQLGLMLAGKAGHLVHVE